MTEEDGKIEDNNKFEKWMYDFAWEVQKDAQAGINRLDNKALNIINVASILIPIITGIFFYSKEKHIETILTFMNVNLNSNILLLGSIAFLIFSHRSPVGRSAKAAPKLFCVAAHSTGESFSV